MGFFPAFALQQHHELMPHKTPDYASASKGLFKLLPDRFQDLVPEIVPILIIKGMEIIDRDMKTDKVRAPAVILVAESSGLFQDAAGIKQPRKGVPPGSFLSPPVVCVKQRPVDKVADQPLNFAVGIINRRLAGQYLPVLPFVHAKTGAVTDRFTGLDNSNLIIHIVVRMDVPAQILIVLAGDFRQGRKAVIIQKRLARPYKAPVPVFPEQAQQSGMEQVVPQARRCIRPVLIGLFDLPLEEFADASMQIPDQQETAFFIDPEQRIFPPAILAVACPAAKQFRKAHIVFFRQTRHIYLRIKNKTKSFPVFRVNIFFRILTDQFRNTLPAGDQVFLCGGENRPDAVFPVVDQSDPLVHIVKMADVFIQAAGVLRLFTPGQVGDPDQHAVPVLSLRPAADLHFIILFAGSEEHLPVTAPFDGMYQSYNLIRKPVIGLRLVQHRLVQGKVEHFRTGNGFFKSSVIIQDAESILGKFHQRQRDTVELSGRNNSFMLFPG